LRSWVESANDPNTDFPIQNLPFGVFRKGSPRENPRVGVAIGDHVLDLKECAHLQLFDVLGINIIQTCLSTHLNPLMALPPANWSALRNRICELLRKDSSEIERTAKTLIPMHDVELLVPARIGDYTDFYASIYHATNVGSMFRPDNPLLPNYKWVPIGYHGRASSIIPSGTPVRRPTGQTKDDRDPAPVMQPSRQLDYELEFGIFVGRGNELGKSIDISEAEHHLFGLCLVNDWSARDIQRWEYQPLGPFLGKNFATSVSPWVVTMEALLPFRIPAFARPATDPGPLPYLFSIENETMGGLNLTLEVFLSSEKMREEDQLPLRLSQGNARDLYWTPAQLLTHHASNGCNLQPGDLLASGTVSGEAKTSRGCLLELTRRGTEPIQLPTGETRQFLESGDEVIMRGYCEQDGFARIGFGECRGMVIS
jgi:fumarylacetoacetase